MYKSLIQIAILYFSFQTNAQAPFRTIHFAGIDWYVRSGLGNPDNNLWSDSKQSVWVDQANRLHLKIKKINGKWYGAEIRSVRPTHYGKHRFYIANRIDTLDKNVVAGLFIYKSYQKEMDIEFSKWRQDNVPNVQFVVQPEIPENTYKFYLNLQGNYTTHLIDWQKDIIRFESLNGHYLQAPDKNYKIADWSYPNEKIKNDNRYFIHINLWLSKKYAPSDQQETEIILSSIDSPISPIVITPVTGTKNISIYPNHYYNQVFVHLYQLQGENSYELYDKQNQLIARQNIIKNSFYIDLSKQIAGVYKLIIKTNNQPYIYRLQKNY